MRKLTLRDFPVESKYSSNHEFISAIGDNLLRTNEMGETINPVGNKLKTSQSSYRGMRWTKGCNKLVIINDKRQELAKMGERSLLTSSVIIEESLQLNRGNQNYESERNKFFVKDNEVTNRQHLHLNLASLDLLWLMNEQELDAVEITETDGEELVSPTYHSLRYKAIVGKYTHKVRYIAETYLKEQWKGYEQAMKEQDGGTIDWTKSFRYRDWECAWSNEHRNSYSAVDNIIKQYNNYMAHDETDSDGNKVVRVDFDTWVSEYYLNLKSLNMEQQAMMLMTHFGFATTHLFDEDNGDSCVSAIENSKFYCNRHVVAESKFKRNDDWHCDLSNLVRAEAMKLNRLSQEGIFVE